VTDLDECFDVMRGYLAAREPHEIGLEEALEGLNALLL
jgi:phosphoglycolate phosphatase-like HAD superfamily hydrolase